MSAYYILHISDDVLRDNAEFFPLPPRPAGAEYACDEAACMKKIDALATDYFKEWWTDAT